MTHVPYVQFPQAIGDLVSGVNTYQFIAILPVVQLINAGDCARWRSPAESASRHSRACRPSSKRVAPISWLKTGPASW